jgi:hypothetical protein
MDIFDIANLLGNEFSKICFYHEISEVSEVCFLESANIIISLTILTIYFIKCNGR